MKCDTRLLHGTSGPTRVNEDGSCRASDTYALQGYVQMCMRGALALPRPFPAQTLLSAIPPGAMLAGLVVHFRALARRAPPECAGVMVWLLSVMAVTAACKEARVSDPRADRGAVGRALRLDSGG